MTLQDVFNNFIEAKSLFQNRDVLSISFTPESIPHREKQINDLGKILAPSLVGARPSNVFIYGRTGTGKSLVSLYVTAELLKTINEKQKDVKLRTIYINCKMKKSADTEYRLIASIAKELGKDVPFTGLPTEQVYKMFFESIDSEKQTIIVIIDEIDTLVEKTGDGILYNLTRINQELKNAKVCIIGITNNLSFIDNLDPRVKSSLSEEELVFPPYNAVQLKDILRERAEKAFSPESLDNGVIEKCAALAAQEHGDARRALDLLRVAGELAERSGSAKVMLQHVDTAEEKIDTDKFVEIIKTQPKQSQIVLYTILRLTEAQDAKLSGNKAQPSGGAADGKKEILTIDVLTAYQDNCRKFSLKALTQRRVSDLIAEFDLFGIISSKTVSRGRYGRTRVITLSLSESLKEKVNKLLNEVFY